MLNQNIDLELVKSLNKKIDFDTFELDDFGEASKEMNFLAFWFLIYS